MSKGIRLVMLAALLAASVAACTAVKATPNSEGPAAPASATQTGKVVEPRETDLEVTLQVPTTLPSGEAVNLRFTLTNNADTRLYVLKWFTPLEGLGGEIFRVERDGQVIPYQGPLASRTVPGPESYVLLDAGESVSAEVDLTTAYDLSKAGEYSIEFLSPRISHVARTEAEMAKTMDDLGAVQMPSNRVTIKIGGSSDEATQPAELIQSPAQSPAVARTITVVGEGKVNLKPDIATINVGAEARANTVSEAKSEVDAQMAAITTALHEAGVGEKNIQTSHYGIHYEREPMSMMREGPAGEIQEGYVVSSMVRVTVRDVEKAGDVLDAVVQAGANQVHGVTFTVSDESTWQSQARANAMADARSRALELAGLADVELGEVLLVSEVIGGMPVPLMGVTSRMGGGGMEPGELELSTQIQVTFAVQ